jgi:tripartite ATP-independent transporter DctM subunit
LLIPVVLGLFPTLQGAGVVLPASLAIVAATALGMPIYAAIGGLALLLFWNDGTPISAVPGETYRLSTSPMLPSIPLFTLGGYILAKGGSSQRLTHLSSALIGWMPGGLAIVTVLVLAFFTPLTGASGITILSMGGLLLPMLEKARYPQNTSMGLVTVSGSIGLLFPPSLPVILYAFYAEQPIERLFVGGLVPGFLLIIAVAGWGAYRGWQSGAERTPFDARAAKRAVWEAKWELLLPVVVLGGILGGLTTLVEAAAVTVLYAFIIECLIFRDLSITKDLPGVAVESATLVGGFMIILAVALGFTSFLFLAQVPMHALEWVQTHIDSPIVFLLALNLLLIVVGALMDIYSAILVIVPLITPMAVAYGIDPVHLGIIFLANMELGYLTPLVGMNVFFASYRFGKPVLEVCRAVLPFLAVLLAGVLVVTYVPWLSTALQSASG